MTTALLACLSSRAAAAGLALPMGGLPTLAWRPLMDPLPVDAFWLLLLVPMAVAVAVVYKTLKLHDLRRLPRQAAVLSAQIITFMIVTAAVIWVIVEVT